MTSFIITYDLNKRGQNYEDLNAAIKAFGTWAKVATTTYLIKSTWSASQICDDLKQHIDSNDELFVAELTGAASWYGLSDNVSNWIQNNL